MDKCKFCSSYSVRRSGLTSIKKCGTKGIMIDSGKYRAHLHCLDCGETYMSPIVSAKAISAGSNKRHYLLQSAIKEGALVYGNDYKSLISPDGIDVLRSRDLLDAFLCKFAISKQINLFT